jgi:hypothetical protein
MYPNPFSKPRKSYRPVLTSQFCPRYRQDARQVESGYRAVSLEATTGFIQRNFFQTLKILALMLLRQEPVARRYRQDDAAEPDTVGSLEAP